MMVPSFRIRVLAATAAAVMSHVEHALARLPLALAPTV
jgi:hypothetical protein